MLEERNEERTYRYYLALLANPAAEVGSYEEFKAGSERKASEAVRDAEPVDVEAAAREAERILGRFENIELRKSHGVI